MKPSFSLSVEEVLKELETNAEQGLSSQEIQKRYSQYGPNELAEQKGPTVFAMLWRQLTEPLILLLFAAALISYRVSEVTDAVVILLIVITNAILGVWQERKAEKSLAALRKLSSPQARVLRDGQPQNLPASELVPGDIVLIEEGDFVPADGRLIEAVNLTTDESALTGESVPVEKGTDPIQDPKAGIGDRINMVFKSTIVTYGRGKIAVTATGMKTEIGKIAQLIQESPEVETPLQKRLAVLGKTLGLVAIGICALIFVLGLLRGNERVDMFMTAVSLAVAAIPEGLPAIVTIVLALGVQKMSRKKAIIRKLPAVETLGSATTICSDKTGTLTQNKMTVQKLYVDGKFLSPQDELNQPAKWLVMAGALASNAKINGHEGEVQVVGDPTEGALVMLAREHQLEAEKTYCFLPRIAEVPFDSDRKRMTTLHSNQLTRDLFFWGDPKDCDCISFTKGAPDLVLSRCSQILTSEGIVPLTEEKRQQLLAANEDLGKAALRVLAVGMKLFRQKPSDEAEELVQQAEEGMIILGLVGMMDPPRPEVKEAIATCLRAGIRPIMITGDHLVTAKAIGKQLGLFSAGDEALTGKELEEMDDATLKERVKKVSIFARVSPQHKVRIVDALQANNHVVAMTGDGVNDAPALRRADIGAAMGITGTDVAKEAADMVLVDDNFATIVAAVSEGRTIFANIKKAIRYLLSCNSGELTTIFLGILFGWPAPLRAIQILWVNLVTDGLPALALGVEPPEPGIMEKKPRDPKEGFFTKIWVRSLVFEGIWIGLVSLFAFWMGWSESGSVECGRTMAFATLSFSQLFQAFNSRSEEISLFALGVFGNKALNRAVLFSALLQILVMTLPPLQNVFGTRPLTGIEWGLVLILSLSSLFFGELRKALEKREQNNTAA